MCKETSHRNAANRVSFVTARLLHALSRGWAASGRDIPRSPSVSTDERLGITLIKLGSTTGAGAAPAASLSSSEDAELTFFHGATSAGAGECEALLRAEPAVRPAAAA